MHRFTRAWCASLSVLTVATVLAATPNGWFGMRLDIDTQGSKQDPVVKSVVVQGIYPDSPAAQGHLAKGDQIIEAEGQPIAGIKAKALERMLQKPVGESLHLRLKHPSGEAYSAVLVAARLP